MKPVHTKSTTIIAQITHAMTFCKVVARMSRIGKFSMLGPNVSTGMKMTKRRTKVDTLIVFYLRRNVYILTVIVT